MSEQTQLQASHCPKCGAPSMNGMTCWDMLGAIIAWEYQDPALMAEHFLADSLPVCGVPAADIP
jgi:hypothetical protein